MFKNFMHQAIVVSIVPSRAIPLAIRIDENKILPPGIAGPPIIILCSSPLFDIVAYLTEPVRSSTAFRRRLNAAWTPPPIQATDKTANKTKSIVVPLVSYPLREKIPSPVTNCINPKIKSTAPPAAVPAIVKTPSKNNAQTPPNAAPVKAIGQLLLSAA